MKADLSCDRVIALLKPKLNRACLLARWESKPDGRRALGLFASFILILTLVAFPVPVIASGSAVGQVDAPFWLVEWGDCIEVNNGQFIFRLYKDTAGFNRIYYPDYAVAVYDERVTVEYLGPGNKWKQRGTPTGIDYTQSESLIEVTRHYTDYLGTTYDVVYTFEPDQPVKITVKLHSGQADDYRIVWSPSGITEVNFQSVWQGLDFGTIKFDWQDAWVAWGDIAATEVTEVAKGKKAVIAFGIGFVGAGEDIVLDPSIIGTTTVSNPFQYPGARRAFYAEGRHWVFYSDGTNIVYRTSTDGSSWTDATTVATPSQASYSAGPYWATFFDGTYIHYARYGSPGAVKTAFYRRGDPASDGTISWSAAEQTVVTGLALDRFQVIKDSEGYPWVSAYSATGWYTRIYKSDTNDGTWSMQSGFPYESAPPYSYMGYLAPMLNGDVYFVWLQDSSTDVFGKLWDGGTDAWQSQETVTTNEPENFMLGSIASYGDLVYFTYLEHSENVRFIERDGTWGTDTLIYDGTATTYAPTICVVGTTGDLRIVWDDDPTTGHFYYKERVSGSWDGSATDWIDASGDTLVGNYNYSLFFKEYLTVMGIIYLTGTSPYDIRYAFMGSAVSEPTVTNSAADNIGETTADMHGDITATGGENATVRGFEWDIDSGAPYANDWHENGDYGTGTFDHTMTGLPPNDTIYWRAYATNGEGTGYSSELTFDTALPLPNAPTNFTITQTGVTSANISWTMGVYATTTYISGKEGGYPSDRTDGYEVYSGNGTSVEVDSLSLGLNTYYYRAWSHNERGYSTGYAEAKIGGNTMMFAAFAGIAVALLMGWVWKRHGFLAYAAAGSWFLLGILSMQESSSPLAPIADIYMGLFWLCVGMTITCALLPLLTREEREPEDEDEDTPFEGEDLSEFIPARAEHRPIRRQKPTTLERQLEYANRTGKIPTRTR